MELIERFINYCKIPTISSESSHVTPSSEKQWVLARLLVEELKALGVEDAYVNDKCIVYGHIKSNCESTKKIGFIAHMDTSPEMNDEGCNPRIIKNYDGKDIVLNEQQNIIMTLNQFPDLKEHVGKDLIVTDGTTLLGADDKAGVAIIMDLVQYIYDNPDYKHANISIAFTPDEEIGEGADNFDLKVFDAQVAYTVDGGPACDVEFENFNAATANVKVNGLSIHPGDSKDRMINALLVAMEFNALLPEKDRPVNTEGYEGFNHIVAMDGGVEAANMHYIIRNHDKKLLEKQKEDFRKAKEVIDNKYGVNTIELDIFDTYSNMREILEQGHMYLIDNAKEALNSLGVEAKSNPIRGGTDGARITFMGLPTPNLGTGGRNYHGKYEYAIIQEMETMTKVLRILAK